LEKTTKIRTHKKLVPHGTMPGTKYLISMEFDPLLYRLPIRPEYDVIELMIRKSHKIDSFVNTTVETTRLRELTIKFYLPGLNYFLNFYVKRKQVPKFKKTKFSTINTFS